MGFVLQFFFSKKKKKKFLLFTLSRLTELSDKKELCEKGSENVKRFEVA